MEGGNSRFSSRVHDLTSHREMARIATNTRQEFLLTTQALIPIRLFLLTPKTYVPLLQPCGYLSCWSLLWVTGFAARIVDCFFSVGSCIAIWGTMVAIPQKGGFQISSSSNPSTVSKVHSHQKLGLPFKFLEATKDNDGILYCFFNLLDALEVS